MTTPWCCACGQPDVWGRHISVCSHCRRGADEATQKCEAVPAARPDFKREDVIAKPPRAAGRQLIGIMDEQQFR